VATRQADCHTSVAAPLNPCGFAVWRKMKTDSEAIFARSYWNGYEIQSWIAYREPSKMNAFNQIKLQKFSRIKWRREVLYPGGRRNTEPTHPDYWDAELIESPWAGTIEPDYEEVLLSALRDGEVPGYLNGERLPAEYWWGKSLTAEEWANYFFRRSDALQKWKKDGSVTKKRRRGRLDKPYWANAEQALRAKCEKEGLPSPQRPKWRSQADAEKLLADFLALKNITPSEDSVRRHARKVLEEFEEKPKGS
jgi:hypothetical protein